MSEKYEKKVLKIYMPDGAEPIYRSEEYTWEIVMVSPFIYIRIYSNDGKEIHEIKGYFAFKEIIAKVEEE